MSNFTSPGNVGNITRVEAYAATGGGVIQAVVYSDANGVPVSLLDSSEAVNVAATNGSWISFNVNYTALPKFTYWIGILFQNAATYYYSSTVNETAVYSASASMAAAICPSGTTVASNALSVYAVYTPISNENQSGQSLQTVFEIILVAAAILGVMLLVAVLKKRKNK
jgi:hypothetical protein